MHILLIANSAWNIWNFRRPVVEAFLADGHQITILAPGDSSVAKLEELGCRFLQLKMSVKGVNPLHELTLLRRLKRLFRSEMPDVVFSYTIKNNISGALAARSLGVPFIPNVTGLGTAFLSGAALQMLAERLYRWAFRNLPVVFFQNEDDKDLFIAQKLIAPSQARLLPGSGIDLDRFNARKYPSEDDQPVFLMIARLLKDKGVIEFVEAARQTKQRYPYAKFRLLGDLDVANRSAIDADTVKRWHNDGTIEYLGSTDDVRPHIAAAHCVVLPSYREGAPRTLIEAAAMARPIITTDVPGCRAVVDESVTGFLCAVRDSAHLTDVIADFIALSHDAKAAMGQAGRAKMVTQFDQTIVVNAYRDAVSAILSQNSSRR